MDWQTYKKRCDNPHTFSRWMLEQTAALLAEPLCSRLQEITQGCSVKKPAGHKGGAETDMFEICLETGMRVAILESVRKAVIERRTTEATSSRGLKGFIEAWTEYCDVE